MIKEYKFNSWSDYKSLVGERLSDNGLYAREKFLFRGQEDSEWPLISSFDRRFGSCEKSIYKVLKRNFEDECEHLPDLKVFIYSDGKKKKETKTDVKFTALGQHYGLPTRWLDWTESPYMAAFFAFQDSLGSIAGESLSTIRAEDKSVAIWALDRESTFWDNENIEIIRPSFEHNDRLYKQLGWFTVLPERHNISHLDAFVEKHSDQRSITLWKFIIPLREVVDVMADLRLMKIDAATLMGGYEGLAQSAINKTIIDSLKK